MAVNTDAKKIEELLSRGVDEVIDLKHLEAKLKSGKQLRVKLGIDPTSPNLHLGRSVPLLKLRDFQELGHKVIFIVGDFTGVIGDTSDKEAERPMLDAATIKTNLKSYKAQAGKIIDLKKAEVKFNSKWLGKLNYHDVGEQANQFSLAEFIARDNIKKRLDEGKRISLREVLYPLMQGYDSVAVAADVEIGGTDQRFNLLAGPKLQPHFGQEAQDIIMNPLVEGTDGRKMSSSWGNTINFNDEPDDMYGKVMSINDELIIRYFEYFTRLPLADVRAIEKEMKGGANPREAKAALAQEIVSIYHSKPVADKAVANFDNVHKDHAVPEDMPEHAISDQTNVVDLMVETGLVKSKSDARRNIEQGGVRVDGHKIEGTDVDILPTKNEAVILQKGKRHFVRIVLK